MPKTKPNVFDGQNITADEFFKTHWQRSPYLFTGTNLDLSCLPDANDLFKLAAQQQVQSRIIYSEDQRRYQAIYDEPEAWQQVLDFKPTLLVSDIEKWFPTAQRLMDGFPFIKNWRFDDLMMSFAPAGASVGAHTDHYDVFLVQVQGSRQWSYDSVPLQDAKMVADSELAVIDNYQAQLSHELQAGDILYLPPEIPHHGISTSDDCITCSIGLRAPSKSELITAVIETTAQNMPAQDRFKDSVQSNNHDASIGAHEISYLKAQLQSLSQLNDQQLAEYFGQFVTGYRLLDDEQSSDLIINQVTKTISWKKSPFAVFAYHLTTDNSSVTKAQLFVNGETYHVSKEFAQTLCNQAQFKYLNSKDEFFAELIETQAIIPA
ncbi:FIG002776: hypothetical protein [hydrothermal vent metagenome]|uniref:JmjC domain-containing protein n=1 Tax=hydrothermal vent metagenome TaxID=652676 RepID=A0A3B0VXZ8_9ZZZZ